jgi:hypothetical protein
VLERQQQAVMAGMELRHQFQEHHKHMLGAVVVALIHPAPIPKELLVVGVLVVVETPLFRQMLGMMD